MPENIISQCLQLSSVKVVSCSVYEDEVDILRLRNFTSSINRNNTFIYK